MSAKIADRNLRYRIGYIGVARWVRYSFTALGLTRLRRIGRTTFRFGDEIE